MKMGKGPDIRTILVPTDFSSCSGAALEYAIMTAKRFKADLILIHVIEPFPYGVLESLVAPDPMGTLKSETQSLLDQLSKKALNEGLSVETHIVIGIPYREIVKRAKRDEAYMIVMGTRGRTGVERLLIGSVAEKVVRSASCPVLTVQAAPEAKRGKKQS